MNVKLTCCVTMVLAAMTTITWGVSPSRLEGRIGLRLLDESETPLVNYQCGIGLFVHDSGGKRRFVSHDGRTGANGEFWVESPAMPSMGAGLGFKRKGFYTSSRVIEFTKVEDGKLVPYGVAYEVLAKRVIKPVPMYAVAHWEVTLPEAEGSFGFDLEKRDWVAPHGAGMISDLIFTQEKKIDNVLGSSAVLRIHFSNRGDGLVPLYELKGAESELKLPRTAQTGGYVAERRLTTDWNANRQHTPPAKSALGYLYRVRTVLHDDGRVKSAWYGKIDGEFKWDPRNSSTGQITFTYYLNPDGTRNLEFDRKKNLFEELPIENAVRHP